MASRKLRVRRRPRLSWALWRDPALLAGFGTLVLVGLWAVAAGATAIFWAVVAGLGGIAWASERHRSR